MLVYRSATVGYIDLLHDYGTENYGGIRPGCWINAIPAGGLVLMPDATDRCRCSYLNKASIALGSLRIATTDDHTRRGLPQGAVRSSTGKRCGGRRNPLHAGRHFAHHRLAALHGPAEDRRRRQFASQSVCRSFSAQHGGLGRVLGRSERDPARRSGLERNRCSRRQSSGERLAAGGWLHHGALQPVRWRGRQSGPRRRPPGKLSRL